MEICSLRHARHHHLAQCQSAIHAKDLTVIVGIMALQRRIAFDLKPNEQAAKRLSTDQGSNLLHQLVLDLKVPRHLRNVDYEEKLGDQKRFRHRDA